MTNETTTQTNLDDQLWQVAADFQQFADRVSIGVLWAEMIESRSPQKAERAMHTLNNMGFRCGDVMDLLSVAASLAGVGNDKDPESQESALSWAKFRLRQITARHLSWAKSPTR